MKACKETYKIGIDLDDRNDNQYLLRKATLIMSPLRKLVPDGAGVYSLKDWIPAFAGMTNIVSATGTNQ